MTKGNSRVFMIGWEYPPHNSGGLGVACEGMTQALSQQNNQIYFSLPYAHQGSASHMRVLNCRHPSWDDNKQGPPFFAYDGSELSTQEIVNTKLGTHELASLPGSELERQVSQYSEVVSKVGHSENDNFDLIHAHDWMTFPSGIELKKRTKKPLITHVHSTEYDRSPGHTGHGFITQVEKAGLEIADKVVTVSQYTKRLITKYYDIPSNKISVVHNGFAKVRPVLKEASRPFAQKRSVVVFMGRLTGQKGPEYFLQLAKRVLESLPNALFVIAGSGDLYHELILQTARQKMSASILFSGFVRDVQKRKLLDRADVFVMPSLSEPFGLVAMEAAQRHTPIIISKTSGVSEVLKSAIAVDFWDVDKMAKVILTLLSSPRQSKQQVRKQLGNLKQASWSNSAQKINTVYRQVFEGSKRV